VWNPGADIQAIVVPRRRADGDLTADASSAAVKGLWQKGNVELEGVVASDYGDGVFAVGSAGPLGGALWFIEYCRSGFGVTDRRPVDRLPAELTARIARGQVFITARDYLDGGGTVEWTPLLHVSPVVVLNLHDQSVLALATAQYSLSNNANLVFGAQMPFGSRGSEFGGRRTTATSDLFAREPYRSFALSASSSST